MKLNFAQRVTVRMTPKHDGDGSVAQKKMELQASINKYKVNIDRSCFVKTDAEKQELKIEKAHYRKLQAVK